MLAEMIRKFFGYVGSGSEIFVPDLIFLTRKSGLILLCIFLNSYFKVAPFSLLLLLHTYFLRKDLKCVKRLATIIVYLAKFQCRIPRIRIEPGN
jgi:hypothetical protein